MNRCKPKRDLLSLLLLVSRYSLICAACVSFLSELVRAKPINTTVQLAQQQSNAGQDAARADAQKAIDQAMQLYEQKTKESLLKAMRSHCFIFRPKISLARGIVGAGSPRPYDYKE